MGHHSTAIVDAKSLFDHLSKESSGLTRDKRTAREMQIIRQSLEDISGSVFWIPGKVMVADPLTKANGQRDILIHLMVTAQFSLSAELADPRNVAGTTKRTNWKTPEGFQLDLLTAWFIEQMVSMGKAES